MTADNFSILFFNRGELKYRYFWYLSIHMLKNKNQYIVLLLMNVYFFWAFVCRLPDVLSPPMLWFHYYITAARCCGQLPCSFVSQVWFYTPQARQMSGWHSDVKVFHWLTMLAFSHPGFQHCRSDADSLVDSDFFFFFNIFFVLVLKKTCLPHKGSYWIFEI